MLLDDYLSILRIIDTTVCYMTMKTTIWEFAAHQEIS
jgi:hypothetical protein